VDSRYDRLVASGVVDRRRWAEVVRQLIGVHANGKKATFAKLVGVDPRTVTDWLGGVYTVRDAMVRQVADRTGESALGLLVEVGVLLPAEGAGATLAPEDAWIVDRIEASSLTRDQKKMLIAVELERAQREREERERQIDEQIKLLQP